MKYNTFTRSMVLWQKNSPNEEVESQNTAVTEVHVNRDHKCIICNKQYHTLAGSYKHNRMYHTEEIGKTSSNMFCRESNCSYKCKTLNQLRNHLKVHGIEMKMTEKHFKHCKCKKRDVHAKWKSSEEYHGPSCGNKHPTIRLAVQQSHNVLKIKDRINQKISALLYTASEKFFRSSTSTFS